MNASNVEVECVTKRFAGHTAVSALSMQVQEGGIFGLLGPNGAGKTTVIRMIMNILEPDEGKIVLFGSPNGGRKLSHRIGYLPEERGLYKKMKVLDHLVFLGELRGIPRSNAHGRANTWLGRLGISDWADRKVEDLSKGMQQKVQFAGALLHDPELLILDEPFAGLDPVNAQSMKDIVVDLAKSGRTILFSTHVMEQAERMCDRIAIIARGEMVVNGSVAEVKAESGVRHVALGFSRGKECAERLLGDRALVASVDDYGASAEVQMADGVDAHHLLAKLVEVGVVLARFEVVEPSLQSIFIKRVGADATDAARSGEMA